jgi:hypothetical protein
MVAVAVMYIWFYAQLPLSDGRRIDVVPLTYGRARICVAPTLDDQHSYEDQW